MTRAFKSVFAAVALAACMPSGTFAAAQTHAQVRHDIDGVWEPVIEGGFRNLFFGRRAKNLPLTPEYAAKLEEANKAEEEGRYLYNPQYNCIPEGMPYVMGAAYVIEIISAPGKVVMITEFMNLIRHVYTDGRTRNAAGDRTYVGDSVGRWEGDTLVVETTNLVKDGVFAPGFPHSEDLRIVERFSLSGKDMLRNEMTLIDPKAFTAPLSGVISYKRSPPARGVKEFVCAAGLRYHVGPDGKVITVPWAGE